MIGFIRYEETGQARTEHRRFGTAAVLTVRVPRCTGVYGALAAHRASSLLARRHVRLAVFPVEYPYTDIFARRGIVSPDVMRLDLACADQIALLALRQSGREAENANVALVSEQVCTQMHTTAHSLARAVRYLTLRAPDADALARVLRRDYGIAAKVVGESDTVRADLVLSFDAAGEGGIALGDACVETSYSAMLDGQRCTDMPLLAALLSVGALRARDIRLERLILPPAANL